MAGRFASCKIWLRRRELIRQSRRSASGNPGQRNSRVQPRYRAERLRGSHDVLFDVAGLAATVGLAEWYSPDQWNLAKLPFSATYLPLYGEHVARIVAALRGKSRRCLVSDLGQYVVGRRDRRRRSGRHSDRAGRCQRRSLSERAALSAGTAAARRRSGRIVEEQRRNRAVAISRSTPRCCCVKNILPCSRRTGTTRPATSEPLPMSSSWAWTRWCCSMTTQPNAR